MRKTVSGVDLIFHANGSVWIYQNTKNTASSMVSRDEYVSYQDPVSNYMTSSPQKISINFEHFVLRNYGDELENVMEPEW